MNLLLQDTLPNPLTQGGSAATMLALFHPPRKSWLKKPPCSCLNPIASPKV